MERNLVKYIPLLALSCSLSAQIQETPAGDATSYRAEMGGTLSSGDYAPFWIASNRYGVVPLDADNAYLKAGVFHRQHFGKGFRWGVGLDLVAAVPRYKHVYIHQLYAELGYKWIELSVGSKERYQSMVDPLLSSGDMILSNNARPIPEVNLSVPEYTLIPHTKGWVQVKGNFSVGKSVDSGYLDEVYADNYTFVKDVLWHHKALSVQLKDTEGDFPLSATVGAQHIAQWGGTSTDPELGEQPHSFVDFLRVVVGSRGGDNSSASAQKNVLGSHHISYDFSLTYTAKDWSVKGYYQHLCYDKSGTEFRNGIDGLWGVQIDLPEFSWLDRLVFEYVTTRNQSGPFHYLWFDRDNHPGRGGGGDNYYNNEEYVTGNSYFNRGVGSPLLPAPEYNADGKPGFRNNRIKDWHIGLQGKFSEHLRYRMLLTVMNMWGTATQPLLHKKEGVSLMANVIYTHPKLAGWQFSGTIGADTGDVFGKKSTGFELKITKTGIIRRIN